MCISISIFLATLGRQFHLSLQYVDALRAGDLELFEEIEKESGLWWHVNLDRGKGGCLHFAVESGQVSLQLPLTENTSSFIELRRLCLWHETK